MSETQPADPPAVEVSPAAIPPAATGAMTQATMVRKSAPKSDYKPASISPQRRLRRAFTVRLWSVRHSRQLEWVYRHFANAFLWLHPVWKRLGYVHVERPVKFAEKTIKGFMFDCRMCGQCVLSSTGMSCPMTCPKQLRNGPCGGVRANGHCEVEPDMPCVWVKAWEGSRMMRQGDVILNVQKPVDQSLRETSSWLRVTAQIAAAREKAREKERAAKQGATQ